MAKMKSERLGANSGAPASSLWAGSREGEAPVLVATALSRQPDHHPVCSPDPGVGPRALRGTRLALS